MTSAVLSDHKETEYPMSVYTSPLDSPSVDSTAGESVGLLESVRKSIGMVPNLYAVMANSPGLLATYLDGYKRFRTETELTPAEQEVVFLTISRFNECTYCMAAHSFAADTISGTPVEITDAIRDDLPVADPRIAALARMTETLLQTRGNPTEAEVVLFRAAGFSDVQVLELVLAIAVKTVSNWTNHIFKTSVDDIFSSRAWFTPQNI